jgi:response regulator RpfG family c-di-GMP phosphodiesterase
MLTGGLDGKAASEAVNRAELFRLYGKPVSPKELGEGIEDGIRRYGELVLERHMMEETVSGGVALLSQVLELSSPESAAKTARLRTMAEIVARGLRMNDAWILLQAVDLLELGAIAVPSEVLSRWRTKGRLSPAEETMIRAIPETGAKLV